MKKERAEPDAEADSLQVCVIGLGYVGLPLAVALARTFATTGFDTDQGRIAELERGHDRTAEIDEHRLRQSSLKLTDSPDSCPPSDFYIVTVPTPIDAANKPDLSMVEAASRMVAKLLPAAVQSGRKPIVVFESTVYPGVTEDFCGPLLEEGSGLVCGQDFALGYSPERINPGDREHTIDKITKVVSGQDAETLNRISSLYEAVTSGGVFRAASIRAAEAAKVIENAQRDINIAFMNEIARIFARMDISVWDVLAAARTKWNFLGFAPGLVGGHCIGVDPYYLSYRAEQLGIDPQVILAGRDVNDSMASWVGKRIHEAAGSVPGRVLVLGLTFKEDVPDLRNSKVAGLVDTLAGFGHEVVVHDPLADAAQARREYGLELHEAALDETYDVVVLAVPHREYLDLGKERLASLVRQDGLFADLKNGVPDGIGKIRTWRL